MLCTFLKNQHNLSWKRAARNTAPQTDLRQGCRTLLPGPSTRRQARNYAPCRQARAEPHTRLVVGVVPLPRALHILALSFLFIKLKMQTWHLLLNTLDIFSND